MKLGIDLGTTRTVVAAVQDGRYPVVRFEAGDGVHDHVPGLAARLAAPAAGGAFPLDGEDAGGAGALAPDPGALALGGESPLIDRGSPLLDGPLLYGWDAALARPRPARFVRSLKRLIAGLAPEAPVAGLGVETSALELLTGYLTWLARALRERSSLDLDPAEPLEAMVAVPAGAGAAQRFVTLEAFRRAGFHVLGLIHEPTAAGIEFAHRHLRRLGARSPKRFVVVYDLGGGTFDASAVSLEQRRFELLATEGLERLGGDDFDAEILVLALEVLGVPLEQVDLERGPALLERCREAKETLTPTSRRLLVDLSDELPGTEPAILPTAELYARCEPLVARTLACLDRLLDALAERGLDPANLRELAAVYVAGGSAAFPPVMRALRARHARKLKQAPEPHAATAVGLAVAADPEAGVFVREATTRHLGVWREEDGGRVKVFDRIVSKGELPPAGAPLVRERRYRPAHRVGHLRYVECTELGPGGEPAGDLRPLGEVLFPYDPALVDRDLRALPVERSADIAGEEIVETYVCGPDGRISVAIENRSRGYRREYRLGENAHA